MPLLSKRPKKPSEKLSSRAAEIHERLAAAIPTPHVELSFENPWQLLIAVILSAQSTDKMVNKVLPEVLKRWPSPAALGKAKQEDVEEVIKSTGFFRNKGKSIRETSAAIAQKHGGKVPQTMEEMLELPGVARKTANVVLGSAFGIPSGITVDVHAARVSQRLKLTKQVQPPKIEVELCALFEPATWIRTGHRFVLHGRYVCTARKPACRACPLNEACPSAEEHGEMTWQQRAQTEATDMATRAVHFTKITTNATTKAEAVRSAS